MSDNDKLISELMVRFRQEMIAINDNSSSDIKTQTRNSTIGICLAIVTLMGSALYFIIDARVEQYNKPLSIMQMQHTMKIEQHDRDLIDNKSDMKEVKLDIKRMSIGIERLLSKESNK